MRDLSATAQLISDYWALADAVKKAALAKLKPHSSNGYAYVEEFEVENDRIVAYVRYHEPYSGADDMYLSLEEVGAHLTA